MLLPLSVEVEHRTPPVANVLLIAVTVLVFLVTGPADRLPNDHPMIVNGWENPWGIVGHLFMHADVLHLFGNMLFLWIFGNAVCSRVGNLRYLAVYLGLGVAATVPAQLVHPHAAVGASGAINGVVGMFAVMFATAWMRVLWAVPILAWGRVFRVPAALVILFWLIMDMYGALYGGGRIGYWAHVSGFVAGFGLAVAGLERGWIRMLPGEQTLVHLSGWKAETPAPAAPKAGRSPEPDAGPLTAAGTHFRHRPSPTGEAIRFRCQCGTALARPLEDAGRTIRCPRCGERIGVPDRRPAAPAVGGRRPAAAPGPRGRLDVSWRPSRTKPRVGAR
jgi:membrane associated rhomboid family serine protease/DNA-directed RNA polymerase subunit RPC12/RpoP